MRKVCAILSLVLVSSLAVNSYAWFWPFKKKKKDVPKTIQVTLPSGETITAYSRAQFKPSDMIQEIMLKGVIKIETDPANNMRHLVLVTDTGKTFVLLNEPYVNTLAQKSMGKTAKLKGKTIGPTTFHRNIGYWIEDILEVR